MRARRGLIFICKNRVNKFPGAARYCLSTFGDTLGFLWLSIGFLSALIMGTRGPADRSRPRPPPRPRRRGRLRLHSSQNSFNGPWQIYFKKPLKATLELFLKAFIRRRKKVSDGSVATRGASNWPSPRRRTCFGSTQVFVIGKSAKECAGAENAAKNQTRRNRLRVRTP